MTNKELVDSLRRLAADKALPIGVAWNALDEAADKIEELEYRVNSSVQSTSLLAFLQQEFDWTEANIKHELECDHPSEVCWNRGYRMAIEQIAGHFDIPINANSENAKQTERGE